MATAAPVVEPPAADAAATAEVQASASRRRRGQTEDAVIDDLAQEARRPQLLDRVEQQLRDRPHTSRLLMIFGIADDRKMQGTVTQEFQAWREKEGLNESITGVLVFIAQHAVQLLEGPSDEIFKALEFFQSLALEQTPAESAKEKAVAIASPSGAPPRPALVAAIRVLHFTELHGVRTSTSWCSHVGSSKIHGGQQIALEDSNQAELVFSLYKKMLDVCLQVTSSASGNSVDLDRLAGLYRNAADKMPTADEMAIFTGKNGAEIFFSYAEFHKVFMAPFHLVLHSELLWPMSPALSY